MYSDDKLLQFAKDDDEKVFIKKIIDKVNRSTNETCPIVTNFLDPGQIFLTNIIVNTLKSVLISFDGGYIDAERKRAIFIPIGYNKAISSQITVLEMIPNKFSKELTHRDFLGSLLGLGLKRETIGDILLTADIKAYVITTFEVKDYLLNQLTKVGREQIEIKEASREVLNNIKLKIDYIIKNITLSSLRLDTLISEIFNLPRSSAAKLIEQGKVRVNYRTEHKNHMLVDSETLISVTGFGRFKIIELLGKTRKGNEIVNVKIY